MSVKKTKLPLESTSPARDVLEKDRRGESTHPTNCPLCGGAAEDTLEDCRDLVLRVPGSWTYRRCAGCRSLWMDPLPRPEEIPGYYPETYYTHNASVSSGPKSGHAIGRLFLPIKLAGLEARFGYRIPKEWWERAGGRGWAVDAQKFLPRFPAGCLVRFLPFREGGRLLDVGCGNGEFLRFMRELGWEVEGIEPDGRAAEQSTKFGLSVRQGGIEDVELQPDSYDAITLSHVIEHLLDPRAALERCVTALRPGGVLVSFSPNPEGRNARMLRGIWRGLEPPRHLILPSPAGYGVVLGGLPVRAEVSTSPMHMGAFWRWSRAHARARWPSWLEAAYAHWLNYVEGPLRVALFPEEGEECVCIARKEHGSPWAKK
ncbi:MAG: class I SAM-dependent methyltransferase [Methylacidiphilaceae bacterium]|nr:class I SAM-dependent methyltransferase [Candidatus Methylacidiphilaceae bacterium]